MRLFLKRALLALLLLALVLYGAFALTSNPVEPHPYFASGDILVIAHRGGKGLAPENTLTAFAHSAALGVDVLEMDLRQSSDGALVVLHDRRDAAYHPVNQAFQVPARLGKIDLIDRRFIARAHAHNVQVHIWTINDPDAMQHYLNLGVDGLITDYPDRLLCILNRQPAEETSWATP